MTCGIYKIENKINGHCYIGQSVNIEQRWKKHRSIGNNYNKSYIENSLYRAIYKYGLENFEFSIIEECEQEILNEREIYWIKCYNSYNNGYNQTKGGNDNNLTTKLNLEEVIEIRDLLANSFISEEDIGKKYNVSLISISSINTGKYWHDENISYPIRNNKKQEFKCKNCGKTLSQKTKEYKTYLCPECFRKQLAAHIPDREILKDKIRNLSFEAIAREYGFKTGNTPKKWCKKLGLPYLKSEIEEYSDEEWAKI